MMYRCPKCGSDDLRVECRVVCELVQEEGDLSYGRLESLSEFEFDDASLVLCNDCEHCAYLSDFQVRDAPPPGSR